MTNYPADTVSALLLRGAGGAPAIGAPGRTWLTHGALRAQARRTIDDLNAMGIGRGDRVAIVLPNGPETAAAFISIACGATTAPLNPAYKADEFAFYLCDLNARVLVVQYGAETPARETAAAKHPRGETGAGGRSGRRLRVQRRPPGWARRRNPGEAEAEDIALVLHTSGTTSRPKIVPLRHINVTASAYHIGDILALTPDDVCLNIMPLFHIHGLIAATLSAWRPAPSVFCTPGFNAFRFFAWFDEVRPTWYTAVPTMHQAILELAPTQQGGDRGGAAAVHPVLVFVAAGAGHGRAGRRRSTCRWSSPTG